MRRCVRALAGALLLALGLAAAPGCSSRSVGAESRGSAAKPDGQSQRPIEMFSWWESAGDGGVLGALIKHHQKAYPGDVIINAATGLSGLARKTLRSRMMQREPPDAFQANVGADIMQWVLMNRSDARESKLMALDDILPEVAEWRKVMPARLLDQVSYDGKMYGLPSNVHRINSLFYNRRVFDKYGLTVPATVADMKAIGKKLKGTGITPLAVGSKEPWTLALLGFECLLVSREGPTFYEDYLHGKLKPDDPRVKATLEALLDLAPIFNPDHAQNNWLQAVEKVTRGEAAMVAMGDWATVFFVAQGMQNGKDYGEIAFPGSEKTFVFTSDAFALPADAKNKVGAERLMHTIGSPEGQRVIARKKGALSPRADVEPPAEEPTLAQKHELWLHGNLVLALSGIAPPRFSEDLGNALAEMFDRRDIEPVVHTLKSRYALLK